MSYNKLNFIEDSADYNDSIDFMHNIVHFFKSAKYLNHLNFSGMHFHKE